MWDKLKREWKTAAFAVVSVLVSLWDAGASTYDYTPLVPDKYKPYVPVLVPLFFLILRRWRPPCSERSSDS